MWQSAWQSLVRIGQATLAIRHQKKRKKEERLKTKTTTMAVKHNGRKPAKWEATITSSDKNKNVHKWLRDNQCYLSYMTLEILIAGQVHMLDYG